MRAPVQGPVRHTPKHSVGRSRRVRELIAEVGGLDVRCLGKCRQKKGCLHLNTGTSPERAVALPHGAPVGAGGC